MRRMILPSLLLVAVACQPSIVEETEVEKAAMAVADREAIVAMYRQRLERIQVGASMDSLLTAYLSVVAEDAVWMPPNAPAVEGREAIAAWAHDFYSRYSLDVDSLPMDVLEVGADYATRRFRSVGRYIPSDGSAPVPYDQKYLDVLRRAPDGSWQVLAHMWSPNSAGRTIWR